MARPSGTMQRSIVGFWVSLVLVASPLAAAHAEAPTAAYDARKDRLEGFDKDELERIEGLLPQGPLALVELTDDPEQLSAINIALHVHAPARTLAAVVSDPAQYPRFMPALDEVDVVERRANAIVYDWAFEFAALRLKGRNTMTIFSAPASRPDAATRVTIESTEGDLGHGRFLFRIVPRGASDSLLVLSMRLDLRKATYVLRQLANTARSVNRSANVALAVSMAQHLARQAEQHAGVPVAAGTAAAFVKPNVNVKQLAPLLVRGDVLLFGMNGDHLQQLTVLGVVPEETDKVHSALRDARAFGTALVPGSTAEIVSERAGVTTFDWAIHVPLVGLSGRMQMSEAEGDVAIDATQGALHGGRWRFALRPLAKKATLVTGWAAFDFQESNWVLEKMVRDDAYLGNGMSAASELMLLRSLRKLATER